MPLSFTTVVQNRNTSQAPMLPGGATGQQTIKWISADRVYIRTADVNQNTPLTGFAKSNGSTPTGWTDTGSLDGAMKVTYEQNVKKVTTGIDEYLRGAYLSSRGGMVDFSLAQFDDVALSLVSGLTPSVISPGSIVTFNVGSTDMAQVALLAVSQDKLTGKEMQWYNPRVYMSFQPDSSKDAMVLKCQAIIPFFLPAGSTSETIFTVFEFA